MGGEDEGLFAIVKLDDTRSLDVDSPLPLDSWYISPRPSRAASVKVERIGEEIVNSVSIHRIQDEDAHLHDTVAVLTNNDKTVRVYSLIHNIETACLDLGFALNHATVSPDGCTLVAVGDFNHAHFFRRHMKQDPPQIPKPHNRLSTSDAEWVSMGHALLHPTEPLGPTGYFTTAWSPNGNLVAVGSEGGYITVFDMELFRQCEDAEEAIVATIASSRPNMQTDIPTRPGAVRSMLFSPDPWDLLIWAEDQGRICVGDLRAGLKSRQVIDLDPEQEGLTKFDSVKTIEPDDASGDERMDVGFDAEEDVEGRYGMRSRNEYVEARRRERLRRQLDPLSRARHDFLLQDDPRGLTAPEQQVLESLRTTRLRLEARAAQGGGAQGDSPRSVVYTSAQLFSSPSHARSSVNTDSDNPRLGGAAGFNDIGGFPELSRTRNRDVGDDTLPPLHSIQDFLNLRDQRQTNTASPPTANPADEQSRLQPRRRTSVVLSSSDASSPAPSGAHATVAPTRTTTSPPIYAHRAESSFNSPARNNDAHDDDASWRTISTALSLTRGPLFEGAARDIGERRRTEQAESAATAAEGARIRNLIGQRERLQRHGREIDPGSNAQTTSRGDPAIRLPARWAGADRMRESYELLLARRSMARVWGGGAATGTEIGVRTAGLAMSRDGRTVWAACEKGIFEIRIKCKGRMMFPAIDMA